MGRIIMKKYIKPKTNPKSEQPKVRIQVGDKRSKVIGFKSTRSNIRRIIIGAEYSRANLKREIGKMKVSEFLGCLKTAKSQRFFDFYGNMEMSSFMDNHDKLFLQIIKKEIYKK
jgi:hypothetical protein